MQHDTNNDPSIASRRGAAVLYGLLAFIIALALASQMGSQVKWISGKEITNQPGFWPVMAVSGMVLFGALELFNLRLRTRSGDVSKSKAEVASWLGALEYVVWFLVYVMTVPIIGYLLATLIFCALLTFRLGYRDRFMIACSLLVALIIVIVFKSFLAVKIPGGVLYEFLPAGFRNFMILYF